jgi:plasmid stability protein
MAQLLIRNLDDEVAAVLKRSAQSRGCSLEALAREALVEKAMHERKMAALARLSEIREERRKWQEASGLPPEAFPDSVELLRESRTDDDPAWE